VVSVILASYQPLTNSETLFRTVSSGAVVHTSRDEPTFDFLREYLFVSGAAPAFPRA
jgi:hypothetical protein